ncbi:asparagine synthase (glutamine-hydrolyzing) [Hahella sp. CCB-MM4]|uniref:asparagine synthase (glutamine-hydrolyzing) n=1 Tax=Hahella sp. (strain CCB-MM4) TaxID=1926491 RepID=UPI000B9B3B57|nr:asparagine synthase (glutamine-hydrolyzing) [Hahella sp. CCB-MM4]OZG70501.1 asparagine synthase (glutamine-hydrolyzing) [Hahella sp. CCB-MM4]
MCGIAGIYGSSPANRATEVLRMVESLEHRGPDDAGVAAFNPGSGSGGVLSRAQCEQPYKAYLGHRRLSIIDLQGSRQPLSNEDGTVWVTFNGEIYNYKELANFLTGKGHVLRNHGDTEVLVHLWEEFAEDMVHKLNGMFAFAIYDVKRDTLFLARDRFGEKPLYYYVGEDCLAFASELHAFWHLSSFSPIVDDLAMGEYLRHGYVPSPLTIYKNCYSLPAGHTARVSKTFDSIEVSRYWHPQMGAQRSFDSEEFSDLLNNAVKSRLIADVESGVFLSGGVDSTTVALSAASLSREPVRTYTISNNAYIGLEDESLIASNTSKVIGSRHRDIQVDARLGELSEKLARHYGQPFADYSFVPTYLVAKAAREDVKVALSGDGGDEVFFGYNRYGLERYYAALGTVPYGIRCAIANLVKTLPCGANLKRGIDFVASAGRLETKGNNRSHMFHEFWQNKAFMPGFSERLSKGGFHSESIHHRYHEACTGPRDSRWPEIDQCMYLPDDILTKVDIASMASSLECRAPLLDHRLVEYVNGLQVSDKVKDGTTKLPLRNYVREKAPELYFSKQKTGFSIPLAKWLRGELREWAYSKLFDDSGLVERFIRREFIQQIWKEHQSGQVDHAMRIWLLVSIRNWEYQMNLVTSRERFVTLDSSVFV